MAHLIIVAKHAFSKLDVKIFFSLGINKLCRILNLLHLTILDSWKRGSLDKTSGYMQTRRKDGHDVVKKTAEYMAEMEQRIESLLTQRLTTQFEQLQSKMFQYMESRGLEVPDAVKGISLQVVLHPNDTRKEYRKKLRRQKFDNSQSQNFEDVQEEDGIESDSDEQRQALLDYELQTTIDTGVLISFCGDVFVVWGGFLFGKEADKVKESLNS
ncbi:hypothetical protein RHGRI_012168 [Rhododendron griersonianum]|uniref:Uncharacterized protein n=1 Tax=Rhododendron griersonianum TaxID=479676 RepID=A0AAV6KQ27_9ERIC|nr:hypothetical protein RHGRI_012168 [Rhododendron griersonianum]